MESLTMKSSNLSATPLATVDKVRLDNGVSESFVSTTIRTGEGDAAAVTPVFIT